jgi:hypothetical protein
MYGARKVVDMRNKEFFGCGAREALDAGVRVRKVLDMLLGCEA